VLTEWGTNEIGTTIGDVGITVLAGKAVTGTGLTYGVYVET